MSFISIIYDKKLIIKDIKPGKNISGIVGTSVSMTVDVLNYYDEQKNIYCKILDNNGNEIDSKSSTVNSGETGTFELTLKLPSTGGDYTYKIVCGVE